MTRTYPTMGVTIDGVDVTDDVLEFTVRWGSDAWSRAEHRISPVTATGRLRLDDLSGRHTERWGGVVVVTIDGTQRWTGHCERIDPLISRDIETATFLLLSVNWRKLREPARVWVPQPGTYDVNSLRDTVVNERGRSVAVMGGTVPADEVPISHIDWRPQDGNWLALLGDVAELHGGWAVERADGSIAIAVVRHGTFTGATALGTEYEPLRGSVIVPRPGFRVASYTSVGTTRVIFTGSAGQLVGRVEIETGGDEVEVPANPRPGRVISWLVLEGSRVSAIADQVTVTRNSPGTAFLYAIMGDDVEISRRVQGDTSSEDGQHLSAPRLIAGILNDFDFAPAIWAGALGAGTTQRPRWAHLLWSLAQPTTAQRTALLDAVDAGNVATVTVVNRRAVTQTGNVVILGARLAWRAGEQPTLEMIGPVMLDPPAANPPPAPYIPTGYDDWQARQPATRAATNYGEALSVGDLWDMHSPLGNRIGKIFHLEQLSDNAIINLNIGVDPGDSWCVRYTDAAGPESMPLRIRLEAQRGAGTIGSIIREFNFSFLATESSPNDGDVHRVWVSYATNVRLHTLWFASVRIFHADDMAGEIPSEVSGWVDQLDDVTGQFGATIFTGTSPYLDETVKSWGRFTKVTGVHDKNTITRGGLGNPDYSHGYVVILGNTLDFNAYPARVTVESAGSVDDDGNYSDLRAWTMDVAAMGTSTVGGHKLMQIVDLDENYPPDTVVALRISTWS